MTQALIKHKLNIVGFIFVVNNTNCYKQKGALDMRLLVYL